MKFLCVFYVLFIGCISTQGKMTTFLDYLPGGGEVSIQDKNTPDVKNKKEEKKHLQKYTMGSGHDITVARSRSYILNGERKGKRYTGLRLTITNPNKFFRFGLSALLSGTRTIYSSENIVNELTMGLAEVISIKKEKFFIFIPSLSAPLIRYDVDLNFGSRLVLNTNIELRTGMAYEWRIIYTHNVHDLYVLGTELATVYLPNDVSNETYPGSISTLDINIEPVHFETDLFYSKNEIRLSFGIGVIW
ncbi:MAG: hypothetical protein A3A89_02390 [Candidatus Magasanikbacteria bacterium RIFCSPLOWO2_01_FULL_33_34]|nr:MAG: hypothetical protein A3B83_01570 [Candidatus Magasanikbacteria bacterium RIFCSPHIGHO2_02_FULL_33_17]OGH76254.1 MAG: hypothetical protein A3A89_02390 [Candidatus Magasanikbacteria bacterium RIFCSPLOWO2_01_FULL_33_34]